MDQTIVIGFYRFVDLPDYQELRAPLADLCLAHGLKGTVLLAEEGINAMLAGARAGVAGFVADLERDPRFRAMRVHESVADAPPFARLKVRLKREIVGLGMPEVNPNREVGTYVRPEDWNALIAQPDVLVIDTRNDFEAAIGTFAGALNPRTASFREFPAFVAANLDPQREQRVAMFCTGGIRCEKATALLRQRGWSEVYHLEGGIINYLRTVPPAASLWEGECFVFDERGTLDHALQPGSTALCHACSQPLGPGGACPDGCPPGIRNPSSHPERTQRNHGK